MIDRAGLEIRYTLSGYRGFESLTFRKSHRMACTSYVIFLFMFFYNFVLSIFRSIFAGEITMGKKILRHIDLLVLSLVLVACSTTKYVPENSYLLDEVRVECKQKGFDADRLAPYIHQNVNSRWFSLFKIPLATYALSGRDSTKWINRALKRIGEEPVLFDEAEEEKTRNDLRQTLNNLGYMHADVRTKRDVKGKKMKLTYQVFPGEPYVLGTVDYIVQDEQIAEVLRMDKEENRGLKPGTPFTVERLDAERKRITGILVNEGYYKFHKDYIRFEADSALNQNGIGLRLILFPYRSAPDASWQPHPRYKIGRVNSSNSAESYSSLTRHTLRSNTQIEEGEWFRQRDLQKTYNNFSRLQAVRYTNIKFTEREGNTLDCDVTVSTNKPSSISFQPEGTNTAGDLGAAASVVYENRNLFHGSELLSVKLRAAFEAITGLEGYQDQDYQEYGIEASLLFPRFVAPFLSKDFRRRSVATSEFSLGWNLQNRPEFHRRVFNTTWRYRWSSPQKNTTYRLDLLDLNYIYMPWISTTFKEDYLDNETSRNAILRYNYEDLFIMRIAFAFSYSDKKNVLRFNTETAGNFLSALGAAMKFDKNDNGQRTLFNIAYAQYVKTDIDYTRIFAFSEHNSLSLHANLGVAYPYGNSKILPFEKRYFAGGANSVRGWSVRELGPGKFKGTDNRIDFINQTGDMKLDVNAEYRSRLFWKFQGAAFVDAGNIWTLRNYEDQPGGQFKLTEFFKQLAVAYGLGLRLNFDYFLLRLDFGMRAVNPAYETSREHYPLLHPDFHRDLAIHFAVGLPF